MKRILLVEDDLSLINGLSFAVKKQGYLLDTAHTGSETDKNNEQVELTAGEYKLLCLFMENPDVVFSPEQILNRLWDCNENYIDNNSLTEYIRRLRKKIEDDPGNPRRIVTVRRMGLVIEVHDENTGK